MGLPSALAAQSLSWLADLVELDLEGNNIGAEGVRALMPLSNLRTLTLRERLDAESARPLIALTSLTSLDLAHSDIGDDCAKTLAELESVTSILDKLILKEVLEGKYLLSH